MGFSNDLLVCYVIILVLRGHVHHMMLNKVILEGWHLDHIAKGSLFIYVFVMMRCQQRHVMDTGTSDIVHYGADDCVLVSTVLDFYFL